MVSDLWYQITYQGVKRPHNAEPGTQRKETAETRLKDRSNGKSVQFLHWRLHLPIILRHLSRKKLRLLIIDTLLATIHISSFGPDTLAFHDHLVPEDHDNI
jgi:hypothetical protein